MTELKDIKDRKKILKSFFKNVVSYLPELSFRTSLQALNLYLYENLLNEECVELIKFDLYRKSVFADLPDVLQLVNMMERGFIKGTSI